MKQYLLVLSLALSAVLIVPAFAKTSYVTDNMEIMMRSGASSKNKIIKILKSGDQLEIIKADAGNNHSEVRTSDGVRGFVIARYLSDTPSARSSVERLEAQIKQLRAKPGALQSMLAIAQEDNEALIKQNTDLTASLMQTSDELTNIKRVSSDAVAIANRNTKLENEVRELLLQLDDIRIENKALKDQSAQRWFIIGVGAILFGLFLGWLLSISKSPRRQSWGA